MPEATPPLAEDDTDHGEHAITKEEYDAARPPTTVNEEVLRAVIKTLDYRATDPDGNTVPIVEQPADRESWEMGARQAIEKMASMYPPEDPVAFALGQLWIHQRAMDAQLNVLTGGIAEVRGDTRALRAKMEEYVAVLPDPESVVGRLGRWGAGKRRGPAGWQPPEVTPGA